MNQNDFVVILCTAPAQESQKIAKALVEGKFAACVNVFEVKSYFMWEEKFCDEKEDLLIVKTKKNMINFVIEKIKELHSYEVPEIIALPIIEGSDSYLAWIEANVK